MFLAHRLKGVAGSLMANRLQQLAARTEAAARKNGEEAFAMAVEVAVGMDVLLTELAGREARRSLSQPSVLN
jgi:HPt (histidine-containing phosphotransfer) domain-containing protein